MSWNPAYPPGYGKTTDTDKNQAPVGGENIIILAAAGPQGATWHAGTRWTAGYSRTARLPGTVGGVMAKLTAAQRKRISPKNEAVPSKDSKKGGAVSGSYPIPDISHARNALARSSGKPVAAQVRRKVYAKYPSLKKH